MARDVTLIVLEELWNRSRAAISFSYGIWVIPYLLASNSLEFHFCCHLDTPIFSCFFCLQHLQVHQSSTTLSSCYMFSFLTFSFPTFSILCFWGLLHYTLDPNASPSYLSSFYWYCVQVPPKFHCHWSFFLTSQLLLLLLWLLQPFLLTAGIQEPNCNNDRKAFSYSRQ